MAPMPDLAEISAALFGDLVDVDIVAKMNPGVSDVHASGGSNRAVLIPRPTGRRRGPVRKLEDRTKRQITAGLSVVGAGAGLYGLGVGGNEVMSRGYKAHPMGSLPKVVRAGWKATPKKTRYLIPVEAAGLTGEVAAARILHRDTKQKVGKAAPMEELVRGYLKNSRLMTHLHAPQMGTSGGPYHMAAVGAHRNVVSEKPLTSVERIDRAVQRGKNARSDVNTFAGTKTGKVAIAGTGLYAGKKTLDRRRANASYDPYAEVGKRDEVTFAGTFSKFDDERRLAFGWANVSKVNGIPVVDRQGDYCSIEDIEDAAYTYVERSRVGGDMHRRVGGKSVGVEDRPHHVADLVESMVFDDAKCEALGLGDDFPRGWWVGFRVFDDNVWEMAKDGRRTGFSIHGKGIRKSVDYDSLMGY